MQLEDSVEETVTMIEETGPIAEAVVEVVAVIAEAELAAAAATDVVEVAEPVATEAAAAVVSNVNTKYNIIESVVLSQRTFFIFNFLDLHPIPAPDFDLKF